MEMMDRVLVTESTERTPLEMLWHTFCWEWVGEKNPGERARIARELDYSGKSSHRVLYVGGHSAQVTIQKINGERT